MAIFKSFLPLFPVVWMLQDCHDLCIPFFWFIFQFCFGCANIKVCIWPETKSLHAWSHSNATWSRRLPPCLSLCPSASAHLPGLSYTSAALGSLSLIIQKFHQPNYFFRKPPWGSFQSFHWDLWFLHCLQKKLIDWLDMNSLLLYYLSCISCFFSNLLTNFFKIFSDLSNWVIFIQSNNDILMVLVNCLRITGEKPHEFLIIARKFVWIFSCLITGVNTSTKRKV